MGSEGWLSSNPGLAGRFDPDSLWLWLAPRGKNSFQAYFRGRLTKSRAGGSRLEGEVLLARWNVALGAFLLLVSVLFFSAAVQEIIAAIGIGGPVYSDLPVLWVAVAFLLTILVFNWLGLRSHTQGREELVSFLERTLGDASQSEVMR